LTLIYTGIRTIPRSGQFIVLLSISIALGIIFLIVGTAAVFDNPKSDTDKDKSKGKGGEVSASKDGENAGLDNIEHVTGIEK